VPFEPSRRHFLAAGATLALASEVRSVPATPSFEFADVSVAELAEHLKTGKFTSRQLTEAYRARIEAIDAAGPTLNSVIEPNPDAVAIAESLDKERKDKGPRGPMHGIPVLIKDNIDTADKMQTTAGSLALVGAKPSKDAFIAKKLRDAGAVILGKTNLSEWANFRSSNSTSGWSSRGGLTRNPYALDRNCSGSSSGTGAAIAASLCAVGIGTETDGSIVSPSNNCGLVGLKPTVGLVSRTGIIPISASQDTAGPMGRTVTDVAMLLDAIVGRDPDDPATARDELAKPVDYMKSLDAKGLKGARLGVLRKLPGFADRTLAVYEEALTVLKKEGAILIDEVDPKGFTETDDPEMIVLQYEFKDGLNKYLARLGDKAPVKSLADVIAFNEKNKKTEMPFFDQDLFVKSQARGPLTDKAYIEAWAACVKMTRTEGIDAVLTKHKLDAIVAPTGGPAWLTDLVTGDHFAGGTSSPAAIAGYPAITVPMGLIAGLPVGLSFFTRAWGEATLLKLAFAFEQATKARQAPRFLATVTM
jgi:amidase